jgi:hypothetical protein
MQGNQAGQTSPGIFELENGRLRICYRDSDNKEGKRPQKFSDANRTGYGMIILEKVETDQADAGSGKLLVTDRSEKSITASGFAPADHELVLRIKQTNKKAFDWKSSVNGQFTARFESTDQIPLGEGRLRDGVVLTVRNANGSESRTNIAFDGAIVPAGAIVKIRPLKSELDEIPAVEYLGGALTFADIATEDGSIISISILLQKD